MIEIFQNLCDQGTISPSTYWFEMMKNPMYENMFVGTLTDDF